MYIYILVVIKKLFNNKFNLFKGVRILIVTIFKNNLLRELIFGLINFLICTV